MQIHGECSQSIPLAFICVTHLETLTCPCHCTICDICSLLQYQAEAHTVKRSRSEGEATIMTSLACSALPTIGPGVLLRRGTHGCAPFSQHSACNIVFPIHNATLHTGFITPCQSAGGSGVSVREQQETGLSTWSRGCGGALWSQCGISRSGGSSVAAAAACGCGIIYIYELCNCPLPCGIRGRFHLSLLITR